MFFGHTHKDLNHLHFLSYFLNCHNELFGEAGVYWEAEATVWWIKELDASGWYRGDGLSRDGFNRPASDGCTPAGLHENTLQTLLFGTHSWSEIALNHFTTQRYCKKWWHALKVNHQVPFSEQDSEVSSKDNSPFTRRFFQNNLIIMKITMCYRKTSRWFVSLWVSYMWLEIFILYLTPLPGK